MNNELKDEEIRGKKMLTGKRLIFAILGAVLAGAVIAGIYYYETAYKYRQYSIDLDSDLGRFVTKIAQDTLVSERYNLDSFILRFIKAQSIGNDTLRLGVIFSGSDVYKNLTLITNHPIKSGETSIFLYEFVQPVDGSEQEPWRPKVAMWPPKYPIITIQDSTVEASLDGIKLARVINPTIVEMTPEQNREQINKFNELAYRYGGTNLSYDTNILVLAGTYDPGAVIKYESIEVVIDIDGNNAKIVGIIKHESVVEGGFLCNGAEPKKDGYDVGRNIEERKWYREPKTVPIKS